MKLFVYGTLKKGHLRCGTLEGQQFIGEVTTKPYYLMYDMGSYPAIKQVEQGKSLKGELWEISDDLITVLDRIEGVAYGLYERKPIQLHECDEEVIAYFYCSAINSRYECGDCWTGE